MPRGGRRENQTGRPKEATGFRAWARAVTLSEKVLACIQRKAEKDPVFALKLAEHGFGRPRQGLDIEVAGQLGVGGQVIFRAIFADGLPVSAAPVALSETAPGGQGS